MIRRLVAAAAIALLGACGGAESIMPVTPALVILGRSERGLTVHVTARRDGDTTSIAVSNIVIAPSDAGAVQANGDVVLKRAGNLALMGVVNGVTLSASIAVTTPPTIVFDGIANGNRDIYRVVLDGAELTRLTTDPAEDAHPTATGALVLFNSFRDGNSELYSVALEGGAQTRITNTTANETQGALSPDSRRVAYVSNVSGSPRVWLATLSSVGGVAITGAAQLGAASFAAPGSVEGAPAWSPSSDRLALVSTSTLFGGSGLFTAAAQVNVTPVLVSGSGVQTEVDPSWSFDGTRMAYSSVFANAADIYVRTFGNSAATRLTNAGGANGQPAWLADGRIVFVVFSGGTGSLAWVDPAIPFDVHMIAISLVSAEHPAPVRQ